jgi:hexosaminidase
MLKFIMWFPIYLVFALCSEVRAVWPAPQSFTSGNSVFWIERDVGVTYNGESVWWNSFFDVSYSQTEQKVLVSQSSQAPGHGAFTSSSVVQSAVSRALQIIFTQSLVPWKLVARNELAKFEPLANGVRNFISCLSITQTGTDTTFKPLAGEVDESYNLSISEQGIAEISAVSSYGVLHGLQTFVQLFYQHSTNRGLYTNMAPVSIIDGPKFQHRGLNMDVSRNWYPKADILRTIDALSWNKFNRLHLHMTDSQSWPMDIPALPLLAQKGAYQIGLSYSPADIQEIQTYAVQRGVEVIIEFDMPGHTTAIGLGYPELIAAFDAHPWRIYCAEPPCGTLQLNNSATAPFMETLFGDVLPRIAPYSSYFHTGGDEVNAQAYLLDPTVRSNDKTVIGHLIQKLVDRNHAQIRAAGLAPIVWEEMLLDWNLTLGEDVVVQTWLGDASVASVTAAGHKALAGNYNFWVRRVSFIIFYLLTAVTVFGLRQRRVA